jgi:TatD DNase family protein
VSFAGNITFKRASALREVARDLPLEGLMVETDAPFLAPEPFRGKPNEPAYVLETACVLSEVKQISLEAIARATTANAMKLFKIEAVQAEAGR